MATLTQRFSWALGILQLCASYLVAKNIDLVPVRRADAFVALYPFLNKLILPAGVANLEDTGHQRMFC